MADDFLSRQKARRQARIKTTANSRVNRMQEDVGALHRFWAQVIIAAIWCYQHILQPISRPFWWVARGVWLNYRKLWSLLVYRRDQFGDLQLSKTRAGLMLAGTVVACYLFVPIVLFTTSFLWDLGMFTFQIQRNEQIYLNQAEEIDPVNNTHLIEGCEELPCTEENSIDFIVAETPFNEMWSFIAKYDIRRPWEIWHPFFPDYIASAVTPGLNKCTITSYGIRQKFLMRNWNLWPSLIELSCQPVMGKKNE